MKFLFTTNPMLGHFLPMVPLIRAVQAAGHEVRVATGADLAPAVHRHGFPLWVVGPMDQLIPMAAAWRPHVVVHEPTELAGGEAAAVSGAVDIVHGLGTPIRAHAPVSTPYLDPCPPSLRPPGGSPFREVLPIRPEVGTVHPGEQLPEVMRFRPYERTIYLTLGTADNGPQAWATVLEAVVDLDVNVLATTGPDLDPAELGPQPGHVALARFVPQALVMPHVDAVVCHAGPGTMLGALAAGRPLVALPMGADQFANAQQIVRSRAGLAVPPESRTPETIRAAITQVLHSPSFARAAFAVQAEIAAMPSADRRAAELVARVESMHAANIA